MYTEEEKMNVKDIFEKKKVLFTRVYNIVHKGQVIIICGMGKHWSIS